jgi:ferredoxin
MRTLVKQWLDEGRVDIFIGYKSVDGHPLPFFFTRENLDEVEHLIDGPVRYPLEKLACKIAACRPDRKIGILARDCTHRALNVLYIWNRIDPNQVMPLDVSCCPSPLKEAPNCSYLRADASGSVKKQCGIDNAMSIEAFEACLQPERFGRWMNEFQKCIKCYGCRNVCPVCFCNDCSLEHDDLIKTGELPPEVPLFHLVRATHMAGRCIDCGLCEEACPMDIPLRLLYRKVNQITADLFDYQAGANKEPSPLNMLGAEVKLTPRAIDAF